MARAQLLLVVKVVAFVLAVGAFSWRSVLFEQYSRTGTLTADGEYQWPLNNHGSIRYITETQQDHLDWLMYARLGLVGVVIGAMGLERRGRGA